MVRRWNSFEAIDSVGNIEQASEVSRLEVSETVRHTLANRGSRRDPRTAGEYTVQFELDYPRDSVIGRQTAQRKSHPKSFAARLLLAERSCSSVKRTTWCGGAGNPRDAARLLVFDDYGWLTISCDSLTNVPGTRCST